MAPSFLFHAFQMAFCFFDKLINKSLSAGTLCPCEEPRVHVVIMPNKEKNGPKLPKLWDGAGILFGMP